MADSGYLAPPPTEDSSKEKIWVETSKRLDRFLPNLFEELFPTPPPQEGKPAAPSGNTKHSPEENNTESPEPSNEKPTEETQSDDTAPRISDVD